ncbi:hypothetical protein Gogos_017055 [Gossypium gossypioides]|uniref:DUF4283 domain-containing protein n=1 Tax=Gossypium gossypioides TaxID=34282 RepID=A0A7J9B9P9_GOSGO|nr:hypothetical protein [Gossypium gossypioides]
MEKELASLNIDDGEEEALILPTNGCNALSSNEEYDGKSLASIRRSSNLRFGWETIFTQIFHELDIERVIMGAPWTFNNHLLGFHRLKEEEDPMEVPLVFSAFWIQLNRGMKNFLHIRVQIDIRIEGDGNGMGLNIEGEHKKGIKNEQCLASDLMKRESGMVINPILGFNLKGYKIQADNINTGPFNEMDHANMEDNPIESGDAKKRPRFENMDLGISV